MLSCAAVVASTERMDAVVISGESASDVSDSEAVLVVISSIVVISVVVLAISVSSVVTSARKVLVVTGAVFSFVVSRINVVPR